MEQNPDNSLRAPLSEPLGSPAQAGDLRRERREEKGERTPIRTSFPKRKKAEGAGSTETPPSEHRRSPKPNRLLDLWSAAAAEHQKKAREVAGLKMADKGPVPSSTNAVKVHCIQGKT